MFPRNTLILFVVICVCMVSCAKDDITPDAIPEPTDKSIVIDPPFSTDVVPVRPPERPPLNNVPIETDENMVDENLPFDKEIE